MGLGWAELVLIVVIVLIIVGPRKLTGLGDGLGRMVRSVRQAARESHERQDR
jgi:Sec-independent protein translocase protein TatA